MPKLRRWRKEFPYYKVQVYDVIFKSWIDEQKIFDTVEAAHDYIQIKKALRETRIIVVESNRRYVLDS